MAPVCWGKERPGAGPSQPGPCPHSCPSLHSVLPPSSSLGSSSFWLCCDILSLSVLSLPLSPSVPPFLIMVPFLCRGVLCF